METLYTSEVIASGGVHGHISAEGGALDIDIFAPSGVRGDEHKKTNPEQLFAASYASCFDATLHHLAEAKQLDIEESEVKAKVKAVVVEKGDLRFALDIHVKLPNVPNEKGERLLEEAYANCPMSKATDGNIDITLNLTK